MFDPQDAATRALKSYFDGALPDFAPTVEGWPEWEEGQTGQSSDFLSITPLSAAISWHAPCPVAQNNLTDSLAEVTYKLGDVVLEMQIDLWSAYKATLQLSSAKVSNALHNQLPRRTGLKVSLDEYFDTCLDVWHVREVSRRSGAAMAKAGDQRKVWKVRGRVNLLAQANSPRQAVLRLVTTTLVNGVPITDPAIEVP